MFLLNGRLYFDGDADQLSVHVFKQAQDAKQFRSDKRGQVDVIADVVQFREALVEFQVQILAVSQSVKDPSQAAANVLGNVVVTDQVIECILYLVCVHFPVTSSLMFSPMI